MDRDQIMSNGDDLVTDLLAQFTGYTGPAKTTATAEPNGEPQPTSQPAVTPPPQAQAQSKLYMASVEVPGIASYEEYEFIPGHFDVRRVISEISDADRFLYKIELRSGEVETVSSSRLQSLNNGLNALQHFRESGNDDMDLEYTGGRRLRHRQSYSYIAESSARPSSPATEEESVSSSRSRGMRRSRRSTRGQHQFTDFFGGLSSDDDIVRSERSLSSDDVIASSNATSRRRRLRRGVKQKRSSKASDDTDSEYAGTKGTRFSTRSRRTARKNLRERLEDEISEHEGSAKETKFYGAKEIFHKIPSNDPFRLRHRAACDVCDINGDDSAKGPLVFCQGCTSSYHQACLGPRGARDHLVTKISDDQFILQCRRCIGVAQTKDRLCPHQGCCAGCNGKGPMAKPLRERLTPRQEQQLRQDNDGKDPITSVDMAQVNNINNLLFRCNACNRGFHLEHLPPMFDNESEDVSSQRFDEYSLNWQCHDCSSAPAEIGSMVAWRPVNPEKLGSSHADELKENNKEYLIRWKEKSYFHTAWMHGSWVWGVAPSAMRRAFFRSNKNFKPNMTSEEAIPEDYLRVDIVFDVEYSDSKDSNSSHKRARETDIARVDKVKKMFVKFKGLSYEEAVWDSPPDPSNIERWNDFKAAYKDWVWRDYVHTPNQDTLKKHLSHVRKQNFKTKVVRDTQPDIVTGGQIMEYQKDGLNWLYYRWFKQQNAILADEMGLGKTIQVIGLFAALIQYHKCWPFLVVVPNSTCPNWRKEIKTWVPSIRVVTYYGTSASRKLAQDYEMFTGDDPSLRCHVVITSYEAMSDDSSRKVLSKIPWAGLVVDEGQRLKNDKSQLYESLSKIKFPFKLLLTGTPLQNNVRELFNLLQFCDRTKNAENLEAEYGELTKENIPELHDMIRPFFLRRTKAQVLTFLPPMVQIIVPVSMSVVQKKLYKSILAKNPLLIKAIFQRSGDKDNGKSVERHNLNNILMQLRKCLCHPFIYSREIEERTSDAAESHRHLLEAAGKLQLLQLMLPKLQQRGHRVLIFSQFIDNLDIMEDFLDGMGILHRRLDGNMSSLEKQKRIEEYNAEGSPYFAFLLSTRSGGVGINLATADTVIIMDPDFNPHQDMQALSRAHRIGQKNKVLVFQLMTRGSAEEKIMQIGKKKMVLDHVLIDRMDAEEDDGRDLESILRHGAQALFDDDDSGDVHYDSESVDKLLDRSQVEQATNSDDKNKPENQFSFARVWANDNQNLDGQLPDAEEEEGTPSDTVWEKILQEREQAAIEEARKKQETLGRGKRKRTTVDYSHAVDISPAKPQRQADSDVEFKSDEAAAESSSDSDPEMELDEPERLPKKREVTSFKRVEPDLGPVVSNGSGLDGHIDSPPCVACNMNHPLGYCRLKIAGVEHCGLCGIAHFGFSRTCPHLRSETQVVRMLEALKQSNESPDVVKEAKRYLTGVKGSIAQRKRKLASRAAVAGSSPVASSSSGIPNHAMSGALPIPSTSAVASSGSPIVDLTGPRTTGTTLFPLVPRSGRTSQQSRRGAYLGGYSSRPSPSGQNR
ncbi:hypothetical protein ASPWEDRAFT_33774 [Aspergillus wentii DTO 134E9]|uniref:Chromatin remodeling complex subunit n=1 Tax=Aspergillus wentii DTO 134E9 TaxID=1073089 RepID=A0A1L9RZK9_ASPWE|nr:uncharacterized protein ASPWEDRAFT_33774 [Aspergillus wentii DTO 134E9]OJJ40391.1 hypothetical protein ASPWEDRAFT_33774 [Aspergillus wentii DTO 134E9]